MTNRPTITLNNGIAMPQLGLGVWQAHPTETVAAVTTAIEAGYRLIDTAAGYGNERDVGRGVRESGVPREELFVTTKLWNADQGYDRTMKAFERSLQRLGLDYIDLYLIHFPAPKRDKYLESWRAMAEIERSGLVRAIGVCNFEPPHLQRLLDAGGPVPAVNQVELNPRFSQIPLRQFCADHDIRVESWSPLGGSYASLLGDETIGRIAARRDRSPAQVIIRWHLQNGLIVIPKSVTASRIRQNADVFDFELDEADMASIGELDTGQRAGVDPNTLNLRLNTSVLQVLNRFRLMPRR